MFKTDLDPKWIMGSLKTCAIALTAFIFLFCVQTTKTANVSNYISVNEKTNGTLRDTIVAQLHHHTDADLREQLVQLLRKAENGSGFLDPSTIIREHVHDPMVVDDFNITKRSSFNRLEANFSKMFLHGLKELEVTKVQAELGTLQVNIQLLVPQVRLRGQYSIDGKLTFFPLSGNGDFWFNVTTLKAIAWLRLETGNSRNQSGSQTENDLDQNKPLTDQNNTDIKNPDIDIQNDAPKKMDSDNRLRVAEVRIDADADDLQLHFENLLGGGGWSALSNTLLNELSGLMFERVKQGLAAEAEQQISFYLDEQLSATKLEVITNGSTSLLDAYVASAQQAIREQGLDPFQLPNRTEQIGNQLFYYLLNGQLSIYDGQVQGLSTLKRTGDVMVTYENNSIALEASFGFENLSAKYSWGIVLMDMSSKGAAAVSVKKVSGYINIRQPLKRNSHPIVEHLSIERLGNVWVDVTGLGKWDFILQILINLVTNTFKNTFIHLVDGPAKEAVQKEFNNLTIDW